MWWGQGQRSGALELKDHFCGGLCAWFPTRKVSSKTQCWVLLSQQPAAAAQSSGPPAAGNGLVIEQSPQSLPSQSRGPGLAVFSKAVFELCQLVGLQFILCPLPLSAAHGMHMALCSVSGRASGLPVDRANPSFCLAIHREITLEQLLRGWGGYRGRDAGE